MLRSTYSSTTILTCQKKYISTRFKLFNYIYHFNCIKNIYLTQLLLFTQYILTPVHPLNTIYQIIYFNTLWVGWDPHSHFCPPQPFCHVKNIMSQHNSNYWTTYIILIISKIFAWLSYTFHSIYCNTSQSTGHNLPNNLFQHILGV